MSNNSLTDSAQLLAALRWQCEMGVDSFCDTSRALSADMTQAMAMPVASTMAVQQSIIIKAATPSIPSIAVASSAQDAMTQARALADAANTLDDLEQAVRHFDLCPLKATASNTVFADGTASAGLMLIGEAPGAEEDKQGIPFCGASGKLLAAMMQAIGRTREHYYITNTLFWRPPGNRTPTAEEIEMCRPFVQKHIALVQPKLLLLVGATAVKSVMQNSEAMSKLRGKVLEYHTPYLDNPVPVIVTFHPSFLLRQPGQKRYAWHDLMRVETYMQNSA